jgi:hypothetical protein
MQESARRLATPRYVDNKIELLSDDDWKLIFAIQVVNSELLYKFRIWKRKKTPGCLENPLSSIISSETKFDWDSFDEHELAHLVYVGNIFAFENVMADIGDSLKMVPESSILRFLEPKDLKTIARLHLTVNGNVWKNLKMWATLQPDREECLPLIVKDAEHFEWDTMDEEDCLEIFMMGKDLALDHLKQGLCFTLRTKTVAREQTLAVISDDDWKFIVSVGPLRETVWKNLQKWVELDSSRQVKLPRILNEVEFVEWDSLDISGKSLSLLDPNAALSLTLPLTPMKTQYQCNQADQNGSHLSCPGPMPSMIKLKLAQTGE